MNKKGQALVEFIIVLPILIFVLFAIIDYGVISTSKQKMEDMISDIGKMYSNNESIEEIKEFVKSNDKDLKLNIEIEDKYTNILLSKKYDFITPGLNKIFNKSKIDIERKIYNE